MNEPNSGISSYRKLSENDVETINEIKKNEAEWLKAISALQARQARISEETGEDANEPNRWLAIATTQVQLAAMALVRAVAKPSPYDQES